MAKSKSKRQVKTQKNKTEEIGIDKWAEKHYNKIVWVSVVLSGIFSLFLFDLKIGVGGDDSTYIKRAFDLVKEGTFPSFQGPLYPILLSVFVLFAGINIPLLKSLSFVFIIIGIYFFFKAYEKRIETTILSLVGIIVSVNSMLLFFASQTYVEAFFFMQLSLNIFLFFRFFDTPEDRFINKTNWKSFIILAFSLFLLSLTKTIGFAYIIGLIAFLLFEKKWKQSGSLIAVFFGFSFLWNGIKRMIWGVGKIQFSNQATTLLQKNPYVPSEGTEDLMGFVQRFGDNCAIYLSKHLFAFFDLREVTSKPNFAFLILAVILISFALFSVLKKNRYLLFTASTMLAMLFVSFVVLQKIWDTPRLVLPFIPFLSLFIFGGLYNTPWKKVSQINKFLVPLVLIILLFSTLRKTIEEVQKERTGIQAYLAGKKLKGYSPDWVNFIKMSEWAAKNTPDSVMIACRKPSISFLYTGRKFFGIYRIPMHEEEAYFADLKAKNTRFVVVDEKKLGKLKIDPRLLFPWKSYLSALYAGSLGTSDKSESRFYGVYTISDTKAEQLLDVLKANGVQFEDSEQLLKQLEKYKSTMMIIKPDELLTQLRERNAKYIIMANLRKYEQHKSPFTINTIRRYMFYVQHKYPSIFRQIGEVGVDEKATLFEVMF